MIAVLQFGCGKHAEMLDMSQDHHQHRCNLFGYKYIQEREQKTSHPIWEKSRMVLNALKEGMDVVWIAADAVWVQGDIGDPIRMFSGISMAYHHYDEHGPHFNAGVMFIRNTRETIEAVQEWIETPVIDEIWVDQVSLNHVATRVPNLFRRVGHEWNSVEWLPRYQHPNPNIVAWHGKPDLALQRIPRYVKLSQQRESNRSGSP